VPFPDFTPTVPELLRHARERFGDATWLVVDGDRFPQLSFDSPVVHRDRRWVLYRLVG
jgi:hypothetical protein